jgi:la-related protein 1
MTSAAARPLGDSGPANTTFSYAQAAKGHATSSTVPTVQSRASSTIVSTVQSGKAISGTSTPPEESNPQIENFSGTAAGTGVADADRSGSANGEAGSKIVSNGPESEKQSTPLMPLMPPKSSPSMTSDGTASTSTLPKEDDAPVPLKLPDSPWDRPSHVETATDKASEVIDRKKGKKGKKEKPSEKEAEVEKEEPKPEILVAAPPPAVNIWQQRKEAQAAKAKTSHQIVESPQFSTEDSSMNSTDVISGSRSVEPKKKAKAGLEDAERSAGAAQNAGAKEQLTSTKTQRKGSEANVRSKEESGGKRPAPRGSRVSDKEEKSAAKILPPPVEDAISWPTPDTVVEEKRKPQEKVEKEDKEEGTSNKPRAKEKWVTVPYIPTVTFNTPLPARGRGGRGGGGTRGGSGRGGHASNGSISGDRSFPSTTIGSNSTTEARERGRDNMSAGRAASLPPNSSKRSVSDNAYTAQDQRKPSVSTFEKPKIESSAPPTKGEHYASRENRRMSMAGQTESFSSQERQPLIDISKSNKSDTLNVASSENQSQQRSAGLERRSEPNVRMNDFPKDANGHGQSRERGEPRSERGRGGYRGRGAHSNFQNGQPPAQHPFSNGHTPQTQNSYGIRQNSIPFSPPPPQQQQQYAAAYPTPGRTGRAAPPRSQSIPSNNTLYSRFSPNVPSAAQQIPPLQTVGPVFDYPGMQTMSAVPYDPYMEQYSLLAMVTMQLEYYFSIDNLCKDVFLRKQMDSKGFVPLTVIQKFKRIQSLTTDPGLLRFACQESEIIEIVIGEDGVDRLRRQDGWDKWVLPMEERDESARNDGPERYFRHPMQPRPQPVVQRMIVAPHSAISPPPFSPNGTEPSFRPYVPVFNGPNGVDHAMVYQNESPLSAAVPDFAPSPQPKPTTNELDAETTFTDEEVDNLQLVYNSKGPGDTKQRSPFHNASSRTFSNGSIDERTLTEELLELHKRQGRTLTNGDSPKSEL